MFDAFRNEKAAFAGEFVSFVWYSLIFVSQVLATENANLKSH